MLAFVRKQGKKSEDSCPKPPMIQFLLRDNENAFGQARRRMIQTAVVSCRLL